MAMTIQTERIPAILLMALILINTAACGNKGPLYLPDAKPVMKEKLEPVSDDRPNSTGQSGPGDAAAEN